MATKSCDGCRELAASTRNALYAIRALANGVSPTNQRHPRCNCGMFVTVETRVMHPVAGTCTYFLCDYCTPPKLTFDELARTESQDFNTDSQWARSVNNTLKEIDSSNG